MSSFQDLLKGVSTYFNSRTAAKAANLELSGSSTKKKSKGQREVERKKDIQRIKGMIGELQRSDLGVKINDIETNFFKNALANFASKKEESQVISNYAMAEMEKLKEEHREKLSTPTSATGQPLTMASFWTPTYASKYGNIDETYFTDPEKVVKLFQDKNEAQKAGYRSAARWMNAHWGNMDSPLYKAYLQADKIVKQKDLIKYYSGQEENTQRSLDLASQNAIAAAEAEAVPLENIRQQTIDTLGREIRERETSPTLTLATETKEGPKKKTTTPPRVKDKLRRVEQTSFYETRPQ